MDWGTAAEGFGPSKVDWEAYNANLCRELVEVPGGIDWNIRRLCESCPRFCWRFIDATVVAQYYFDLVRSSSILREAGAQRTITQIPTFYATLPHFVSPFELSIQPKFLDKVRERLSEGLNKYYSQTDVEFEDGQMFEAVPCVVREGDKWFRGRIAKVSGDNAEVRLVDYGLDRIVSTENIRPLVAQFGRIPPLALKCRVKDVYINDLDTAKVAKFKEIVCECNNLIRVEIASNEEPFFVNIYHPTLLTENLGKYFYRPEDHAERELAKQRKWLDHVRREENENDSDFSDEDEDEEGDGDYEPLYVKTFDRSPKFPKGLREAVTLSFIENSTLIYLQAPWMVEERRRVEDALKEEWNDLPRFGTVALHPGTACALKTSRGYHRAVVDSTASVGGLLVLLVDYGSYEFCKAEDIRPLTWQELFSQAPLVYVVAMERGFSYFPHPTETRMLREMVPEGMSVMFEAARSRNRVPIPGNLFTATGNNVNASLAFRLLSNRVDVLCRAVVPFSPLPRPPSFLPPFVHRLSCHPTLAKGNLTKCTLSEF